MPPTPYLSIYISIYLSTYLSNVSIWSNLSELSNSKCLQKVDKTVVETGRNARNFLFIFVLPSEEYFSQCLQKAQNHIRNSTKRPPIFFQAFKTFLGRFSRSEGSLGSFGRSFGALGGAIWPTWRHLLLSYGILFFWLCRFDRLLIARSALGRRFWTHVEAQMGRFWRRFRYFIRILFNTENWALV